MLYYFHEIKKFTPYTHSFMYWTDDFIIFFTSDIAVEEQENQHLLTSLCLFGVSKVLH